MSSCVGGVVQHVRSRYPCIVEFGTKQAGERKDDFTSVGGLYKIGGGGEKETRFTYVARAEALTRRGKIILKTPDQIGYLEKVV